MEWFWLKRLIDFRGMWFGEEQWTDEVHCTIPLFWFWVLIQSLNEKGSRNYPRFVSLVSAASRALMPNLYFLWRMKMSLAFTKSRIKSCLLNNNGAAFCLLVLLEYNSNFFFVFSMKNSTLTYYDNSLSLSTLCLYPFPYCKQLNGKQLRITTMPWDKIYVYIQSTITFVFVYFLQIIIIRQIPFVMHEDHQMRRNISFVSREFSIICDHFLPHDSNLWK